MIPSFFPPPINARWLMLRSNVKLSYQWACKPTSKIEYAKGRTNNEAEGAPERHLTSQETAVPDRFNSGSHKGTVHPVGCKRDYSWAVWADYVREEITVFSLLRIQNVRIYLFSTFKFSWKQEREENNILMKHHETRKWEWQTLLNLNIFCFG